MSKKIKIDHTLSKSEDTLITLNDEGEIVKKEEVTEQQQPKLTEYVKQLLATKKLLNYDTSTLEKFEPETKKASLAQKLKVLLTAMLVMGVILYLFIVNVDDLGKEKSQSIEINTHNNITYNLTRQLLPLHKFSQFWLYEIYDRRQCLVEKDSLACLKYCN